jgi:uncharacterized membrane protein YesL
MPPGMTAFRTLWIALVSLYEETMVLVGGNWVALALNLPIGLALFLLALPFVDAQDELQAQWVAAIIAWLLPFLPTPGNVALAGLTRVAAGPDVPRFAELKASLRQHWRLALRCSAVSLLITTILTANVFFYAVFGEGWVRLASILWVYATMFWLSLHLYLVPLMVHVAQPRAVDLYRRAAFIALGHPGYSMLLLLLLLALGFAAVIFLPVYLLVSTALISLAQAHALREIRRRHGDLVAEVEEEVSRL